MDKKKRTITKKIGACTYRTVSMRSPERSGRRRRTEGERCHQGCEEVEIGVEGDVVVGESFG